jgi:hypothetical protein
MGGAGNLCSVRQRYVVNGGVVGVQGNKRAESGGLVGVGRRVARFGPQAEGAAGADPGKATLTACHSLKTARANG